MKRQLQTLAAALGAVMLLCGCEGGGGGSFDIGDNNKEVVVCIGDSITYGWQCDGPSYPANLAAMTGKHVHNAGVPGAYSSAGVSAARSAFSKKPAYMCILYGSNDAIMGRSHSGAAENVRAIIRECRQKQVIPVVASPPPMIGEHSIYNGDGQKIGELIKSVCKEEGVKFIDLYNAFGSGEGYFTSDGLHPNAAGAQLIAKKFAGAL